MSKLVDELYYELTKTNYQEQGKDLKWYFAKPVPFKSLRTKVNRIKDAIRVANGKSFAVHYKRDE